MRNDSVLFASAYNPLMASTRFRVAGYIPLLRERGWCVEVLYFQHNVPERLHIVRTWGRLLRLLVMARRVCIVVLHKSIFPKRFMDLLCQANPRIILDIDDAPHVTMEGEIVAERRQRLKEAVELSRSVIVGSHYLKNLVGELGREANLLWTPVKVSRYAKIQKKNLARMNQTSDVVIGWSGSSGFNLFVSPLASVFDSLYEEYGDRVQLSVCMGEQPALATKMPVQFVPWSLKIDHEHLSQFSIGIMPLPDNHRTRAKGGFKLLRYMASAIPVVASNVGESSFIVRNGYSGILVDSIDDWHRALRMLIENCSLREHLISNALQVVEQNYDTGIALARLLDIFDQVQ